MPSVAPLYIAAGAAALVYLTPGVSAQSSSLCATPLASQHYDYPSQIPYQVQPDQEVLRGRQTGYNICNSTTEGQSSMCQTAFINHVDGLDFCLWAPPNADSTIADTEGEEVAWCTKPGHGTRLMPEGTLKGLQFMKTPDYVQVVGFIDQTKINIQSGDYGGELDPHGADFCGNPMGSLLYSNFWSGNNDTYTQVIEWHNFMGGDAFCFKACNPAGENAAHFCEHIYDRIGCAYNAPNNAQEGVFEYCEGDNQDYPGVYTDSSGAVVTYTQPAESLGAISSMPYTAKVPASSNCVQYQSSELFSALATVSASVSGSGSASVTASGSKSTSTAKSSSSATKSGSAAAASGSGNSAESIALGSIATLFGVVGSMLFLS